jgi:hypothetical protein
MFMEALVSTSRRLSEGGTIGWCSQPGFGGPNVGGAASSRETPRGTSETSLFGQWHDTKRTCCRQAVDGPLCYDVAHKATSSVQRDSGLLGRLVKGMLSLDLITLFYTPAPFPKTAVRPDRDDSNWFPRDQSQPEETEEIQP